MFSLQRENVLTTDATNPLYSVAAGAARSQGVELEARFNVTDHLNLVASYTWLDTVYTRKNDASLGKHLQAIPENQASAWATYTFDSGPLNGLSLGGGVRYTGQPTARTTPSR